MALAGAGAALAGGGAFAQTAPVAPPVAPIKPRVFTDFGVQRTDNYYWLNKPADPAVLKYLNAENDYYDQQMATTVPLQKKLAQEIKNRIKQEDATEPYRDNGYYYYSRFEFGREYPIYCRKKGSAIGTEEILLNGDEMGTGQAYFQIGDLAVSDNNQTGFLDRYSEPPALHAALPQPGHGHGLPGADSEHRRRNGLGGRQQNRVLYP